MVTQNGDGRSHLPEDSEGISAPQYKAIPRLDADYSEVHSPRVPPPKSFSRTPSLRVQHEELFLSSDLPAYPLQIQNGVSTRMGFRSPTFPTRKIGDDPQAPMEDSESLFTPHSGAKSVGSGLRISMSMSGLRSRGPSPHLVQRYQTESSRHGPGLPHFPSRMYSDLPGDDLLRFSLTSGMTSGSSIEQAGGTERSSVLTKHSSTTEFSPVTPERPFEIDPGMSVEDAIAMYLDDPNDVSERSPLAEGMEDPINPEPVESGETAPLEDDSVSCLENPSTKFSEGKAEATSTPTGDFTTSKEHPDQGTHSPRRESVVAIPGVIPPPFLSGTDVRDRYGFRKATHYVTLAHYELWHGPYASYLEQRKRKWASFLQEHGLPSKAPITFPVKSAKAKRFVRKGIPPEYRGVAWFWYAGGYSHLHRNPGRYEQLVKQAMESPTNDDKEHIERDLHRTFPDNIHFKPEVHSNAEAEKFGDSGGSKGHSVVLETEIIRSLRRVLYAFALHNPRIGYTQSLNFITGLLLLFLPEEKAFWMLHIITSEYLPGTHEISLEGANVDLWVLMVFLKESMPGIYAKIANAHPTTPKAKPPTLTAHTRLPDITLGLTNWLMSLFIGSLPLETTLRVWDIIFYEGSKIFFRVALAIFKACEKDILAVSDPMEVFQIVQTVPKKLLDVNSLLDDSFSWRFRITHSRIDSLRAVRRSAIREEKIRRSIMLNNELAGKGREETPSRKPRGKGALPSWSVKSSRLG